MKNKIVLITGATGGIGLATAAALVNLGATLILVGRDPDRGQAALRSLHLESSPGQADLLLADLSSLSQVRQLARQVRARYPRVDVLINNAGGLYPLCQQTEEGYEATFVMNLLSPYLLTRELLPWLVNSPAGSIINVSGGVPLGRIELYRLASPAHYRPFFQYSQTKLANLVWSYSLAHRLKHHSIRVNAVYPGAADTAMTQSMGRAMPAFFRLMEPLFRLLGSSAGSPAKAAMSTVRVASDPGLAQVTGGFFGPGGKARRWTKASRNLPLAQQLEAMCEQWVGQAAGYEKLSIL